MSMSFSLVLVSVGIAKHGKDAPKGVNVLMLVDKFHTISSTVFGGVEFKDIYEAYYERKM